MDCAYRVLELWILLWLEAKDTQLSIRVETASSVWAPRETTREKENMNEPRRIRWMTMSREILKEVCLVWLIILSPLLLSYCFNDCFPISSMWRCQHKFQRILWRTNCSALQSRWLKSYKQVTSLNLQRDSNRYYVIIIVVEVVVQQQLGSSSRLLNM